MCGGGGCGKIIGLAASFVVPYIAAPYMASLGVGGSIALGAATGAVTSAITGGNILTGALTGGAFGGIGYGLQNGGFGAQGVTGGSAGLNTATGSAQSMMGGSPFSAATAAPSAITSGAGDLASGSGLFGNVNGSLGGDTMLGGMQTSGGLVNPNSANLTNLGGGQSITTGLGGMQPTAPGPSGFIGSGNGVALDQTTGALPDMQGGTSFMDKINGGVEDIKNKVSDLMPGEQGGVPTGAGGSGGINWKDAGIKLGAQAVGSMLGPKGPDYDAMSAMLAAQQRANMDTYTYNVGQQNKKSAIGDSLAADAANMDPSYYGRQAQSADIGRAETGWADQEAALRAAGRDENYINAMRAKHKVMASTSAGTAYDKGSQAGLNARNSTFTTAGGMYGPVSGPQTNIQDSMQLAKQSGEEQKAIGSAIEQAFMPVRKTDKIGANSTAP